MDIATLAGFAIAVGSLILGFTLDGGSLGALFQPTALIIIFGGTLGATMITVSLKQFMALGKYMRISMFHKPVDPLDVIEQLVELATIARREGILALDQRLDSFEDDFLRSGLQFIVDGVDPELVKSMMETELSYIEDRHEMAANIFETAGGFAPTMGIIGTVMGLVHVLGNLKDVQKLGPEIATAFTATLYGVASANVLWLPIANKLKRRNSEEILLREMMLEGVLSIQAGENPNILGQKLRAFLAPATRTRKAAGSEKAGEANVKTAQT